MRVVINHKSGSRQGRREVFNRESVLIGRGDPNDIALDPFQDPTVSAQHAEIRFERDGFVLYDMGSLNGTFLNGTVVRRALLNNGDEIGLGQKGPRLAISLDKEGSRLKPHQQPADANAVNTKRGTTSLEFELPEMDQSVVSRSPSTYVALATLGLVTVALAWFWFTRP